MRFLSLCSGIEAASAAWLPLGWTCVGVAEVDPFCCALLRQHYPNAVNLGDVNEITQEQVVALGHIDVVVFGFPCQDLSVAGQRKGLHDANGNVTRSGLFFACVRVAEWARARFVVAENVPGLLSANAGGDFGRVVGELAGCECRVRGEGWRNSGVALGPKGLVEWSTLDAQYWNVAQRRARVFIVRDAGNWANRPPLLFDAPRLRWNTPPRRETGQGTPHSLAPCVGSSGRGFERTGETRGQDCVIPIQEIGKRCSGTPENGVGHGQPGERYDAETQDFIPVAFTERTRADGRNLETLTNLAYAVTNPGQGGRAQERNLYDGAYGVRRLTPREVERLFGFPDDYTLIPYRGKPAKDGPRYRALGNSIAVPVLAWLARRIELVESLAPCGKLAP